MSVPIFETAGHLTVRSFIFKRFRMFYNLAYIRISHFVILDRPARFRPTHFSFDFLNSLFTASSKIDCNHNTQRLPTINSTRSTIGCRIREWKPNWNRIETELKQPNTPFTLESVLRVSRRTSRPPADLVYTDCVFDLVTWLVRLVLWLLAAHSRSMGDSQCV